MEPLELLGSVLQEDVCIMHERASGEHLFVAGVVMDSFDPVAKHMQAGRSRSAVPARLDSLAQVASNSQAASTAPVAGYLARGVRRWGAAREKRLANAVGVEGLEAFRLRPRLPTFASFGGGEERFTKLSAQCIAEQPQQPATWDPVPSNPFDDETFAYDVDDHIKVTVNNEVVFPKDIQVLEESSELASGPVEAGTSRMGRHSVMSANVKPVDFHLTERSLQGAALVKNRCRSAALSRDP
eukprot:g14791.t1